MKNELNGIVFVRGRQVTIVSSVEELVAEINHYRAVYYSVADKAYHTKIDEKQLPIKAEVFISVKGITETMIKRVSQGIKGV